MAVWPTHLIENSDSIHCIANQITHDGIGYKSSPNYNALQTASSDKIKLLKFRSLVFSINGRN